MGEVEVRGFAQLKELFEQRKWQFPYRCRLDHECDVRELVNRLELPLEKIEAVFINGKVHSITDARVCPGDRVAFIPYGTPGVCRFLLGIKRTENDSLGQR